MSFYEWLGAQITRQDKVGAFARHAIRDRVFIAICTRPKTDALHLYLSRYQGMPDQRDGVKIAHREWRQVRRCE